MGSLLFLAANALIVGVPTVMLPVANTVPVTSNYPIDLRVDEGDGSVRLSVVGHSAVEMTAQIELVVEGASRLHTRSNVTLRAGAPAITISRAQLQTHVPWSARLTVSWKGGQDYQIVRGSEKGGGRTL